MFLGGGYKTPPPSALPRPAPTPSYLIKEIKCNKKYNLSNTKKNTTTKW